MNWEIAVELLLKGYKIKRDSGYMFIYTHDNIHSLIIYDCLTNKTYTYDFIFTYNCNNFDLYRFNYAKDCIMSYFPGLLNYEDYEIVED